MSSKVMPLAHAGQIVKDAVVRSQVAVSHTQGLYYPTVSRITSVEVRDENDGPAVRVLVGRRIGRFELVRRCRPDGIGNVWHAQFEGKERQVRLRIVRHDTWNDANQQDQWLLSLIRCAQLRHPAIAPIREVACMRKYTLIASDCISGNSLAKTIEKGSIDVRSAVGLMVKLADALQYAHDRGAFHGDLTPHRIMLTGGRESLRPIVHGFGAADVCGIAGLNGRNEPKRLAYASPERVQGEAMLNGAADVYSLGVLLYELVTGDLPFRGVPEVIIPRIIHEPPMAPRRLNPSIPVELESIVLRCLAKSPGARHSAGELASELRRWLEGDSDVRRLANSTPSRRWTTLVPMVVIPAASLLGWPCATWLRSSITPSAVSIERRTASEDNQRSELSSQVPVGADGDASPDEMDLAPYLSQRLFEQEEVEAKIEGELDRLPADQRESTSVPDQGDPARLASFDEDAARLYRTARRARRTESSADALEANITARTALQAMRRDAPSSVDVRSYLVSIYLDAARLQRDMGLSAESESSLDKVHNLIKEWTEQEFSGDQRRRLPASYFELAELYVQFGRDKSALENYEKSLALRAALAADEPSNVLLQQDLAESQCSLALLFARLHRASESRELLASVHKSMDQLASAPPVQPRDQGRFWNNIGCTEFALADYRSAYDSFERASNLFERELSDDAGATKSRAQMSLQMLVQCYENRGIAQRAAGNRDAAERSFEKADGIRARLKRQ
jgi:serine/threonine protein kinase